MRRVATICCTIVCCLGLAQSAGAQEKFSLSMFHFNVQYVAGGLKGYPSGSDNRDVYDLDDAEAQDQIIVETFDPVLDLFLAHPDWKVTLEMQTYMVEILIERHPAILTKLKQLADRGQAELVSFHWSDQLFLAYPRHDLEVSQDLAAAVWERAGLTPSPVVFCQEGQFGVGMAPLAEANGQHILVLPKNLFRYQHLTAYESAPPLYALDDLDVILGARSFATAEVEVSWNFFDDGELLATGGLAPYMGKDMVHDPAAIAEYEQRLSEAEAAGFRIASIEDYVNWAKANGLAQEPLPPVLDGTWQPPSTDSMHRWMGASGLIDQVYGGERDNAVLTGNVQARHWALAAETLIGRAEQVGWIEVGEYDAQLEACWREVLLAQVSDASGINPFVGETLYAFEHAAAGLDCAGDLLAELAQEVGGPYVMVDTATGEVFESADLPGQFNEDVAPLFSEDDGFTVAAAGRQVSVSWQKVGLEDGITRLTLTFSPSADGERLARVEFPLDLDGFYLTPGLVEDRVVFHPFSDFEFQEGRITLPVANGLIGLAEDRWLIKQTSRVHIGASFEIGSGLVAFEDQTLGPDDAVTWVFWIVDGGASDALELADQLNLHPVAWVETGLKKSRGCGCASGPAGASDQTLLLLLGLVCWRLGRRQFFSR